MKFALTTSSAFHKKDKAIELMKLGIGLETLDEPGGPDDSEYHMPRFREDFSENKGEVEINNLEELMDFIEKWGKVVVSEDSIEIYDSYRE